MNKRRIICGVLLVFTFLFFYFWIPNSLSHKAPTFFGLTGAVLFVFFAVQVIGWRHKSMPFLVVPGTMIVFFIFSVHFSSNLTDELKKYGEKTTGTIISGQGAINSNSYDKYNVSVQYYTKDGDLLTVDESVLKEEFNSFHRGQQVELVYSQKNPEFIKLLTNDRDIEQLTGVKYRNIEIKDLTKLFGLKNDSIASFLNTISYKWIKQDSTWYNEHKRQFIKLNQHEGVLIYAARDASYVQFPQLLIQEHFHQVNSNSANKRMKQFESDSFYAVADITPIDNINYSTLTLRKK
jgi:hypothetical protein